MSAQSTDDSSVTLTRPLPHVALLTIDNPPANTLSWASRKDMIARLQELAQDLDVRAVVLTGTGAVFTAGADLAEKQTFTDEDIPGFVSEFDQILRGVESLRVPVIAAVNGHAIGGGLELALACDIRIAAPTATFVAAGVNVGLMANFWRLTRIIGQGPAKEILLTGEKYSAADALRWGLVTEVHPGDELIDAALAKAARIATRAPLSVEATKFCAGLAPDLGPVEADELQVEHMSRLFATQDHREALAAFFERRAGDYHRK